MAVSNLTKTWQRVLQFFGRSASAQRSSDDLVGAPVRPRIKTYSADSGYVYQHVYRGQRNTQTVEEYVFSVSARPGEWQRLSVQLRRAVISGWERENGRTLTPTQRYAVAKMSLFHFLEEAVPGFSNVEISPDQTDIQRRLEQVDLA